MGMSQQSGHGRDENSMATPLVRQLPVDLDGSGRVHDARLVELVMALSGCSARRALDLIRRDPTEDQLNRVAFALASLRTEAASALSPTVQCVS